MFLIGSSDPQKAALVWRSHLAYYSIKCTYPTSKRDWQEICAPGTFRVKNEVSLPGKQFLFEGERSLRLSDSSPPTGSRSSAGSASRRRCWEVGHATCANQTFSIQLPFWCLPMRWLWFFADQELFLITYWISLSLSSHHYHQRVSPTWGRPNRWPPGCRGVPRCPLGGWWCPLSVAAESHSPRHLDPWQTLWGTYPTCNPLITGFPRLWPTSVETIQLIQLI